MARLLRGIGINLFLLSFGSSLTSAYFFPLVLVATACLFPLALVAAHVFLPFRLDCNNYVINILLS